MHASASPDPGAEPPLRDLLQAPPARAAPGDRAEARKGSLMRAINADVRNGIGDEETGPVPFFCECASHGCYQPLWLTPVEYDRVSADAAAALAPGHLGRAPGVGPDPARPAALLLTGAA